MLCPHCRQNNPDNQFNCSYCHQPLNIQQQYFQQAQQQFNPFLQQQSQQPDNTIKHLMILLGVDFGGSILVSLLFSFFSFGSGLYGLIDDFRIYRWLVSFPALAVIILAFVFMAKTKHQNVKTFLIIYAVARIVMLLYSNFFSSWGDIF
jgi:hypothetical protein